MRKWNAGQKGPRNGRLIVGCEVPVNEKSSRGRIGYFLAVGAAAGGAPVSFEARAGPAFT